MGGRKPRIHAGFRKRANARPARGRRTAAWAGGQIAQLGASGEMRKVVEWQGLRRGERIFVVSAAGNAATNRAGPAPRRASARATRPKWPDSPTDGGCTKLCI
jgi:hypothetical protein